MGVEMEMEMEMKMEMEIEISMGMDMGMDRKWEWDGNGKMKENGNGKLSENGEEMEMESKGKWKGSGMEMEVEMEVGWKWRGVDVDLVPAAPPRRHQLQGSALGASSTSRSPSCSEAVLPSPTLLTPFPLSPPSPRGPQGEEGGIGRVLPAALRRRPAAGSSYSGPGSMAAAALGGGEQGWGTPGKNPGAAAEPDALSPIYKQGPPAVRMSAWDFFRSFPRPFPFPKGLQCSHCHRRCQQM